MNHNQAPRHGVSPPDRSLKRISAPLFADDKEKMMTEDEDEKKLMQSRAAMQKRINAARFALIETIAHEDSSGHEYAVAIDALEKLEDIAADDLI
jgi:hypothetical protein